MIRTTLVVLAGAILAASVAAAQSATAAQTPTTPNASAQTEAQAPQMPSGPAVNAELNSTVDSKKVKSGDKVEAHTTEAMDYDGKTVVPKGTKLEGHITEATARSKGDKDSTLAIQFDKAIPKKGEEIPLNVEILAVAAPQQISFGGTPGPGNEPATAPAAAQGSPMGASRSQASQNQTPSMQTPGAPMDAQNGSSGNGQLPANSRGVYGLKGLKLMMNATKTSQSTVITSDGKNVRLDSGTRLLLVAHDATPPSASAPSR